MGKRSKRKQVKRKSQKIQKKAALKETKRRVQPPLFRDNIGNKIRPIELVFPIVRLVGGNKFEAIGTGFFIHPAGGFVTAKHCLFDGDIYDANCFVIDTIREQHPIRKIQYFEAHPKGDIGVGMLQGQVVDLHTGEISLRASLPVSLTPPNINDEISTLAYPRMTIDQNKVGNFPCDQYTGKIFDYLPHGTNSLKSACFVTNMEMKSGASGGPVLRGNQIIGVNSSALDMPESEVPISFITPIQQIFDLTLRDSGGTKTSIKKLMESGHMAWVP